MNERKRSEMYEILDSYDNGQRKQMVNQIDEYGRYDFWSDLVEMFDDSGMSLSGKYERVVGMIVAYSKIKER